MIQELHPFIADAIRTALLRIDWFVFDLEKSDGRHVQSEVLFQPSNLIMTKLYIDNRARGGKSGGARA